MTKRLTRSIGTVCATALLATGFANTPQQSMADNDFLKGLAVGIGGALIVNESKKAKKKQAAPRPKAVKKAAPAGPRPTIATFPTTRDQVRDYQARLNSLGFNAGAPDGLYGGKTRTAVSQFQASIGAAPTGKLTEADASMLFQQSNQFAAGLAATATPNGLAGNPQAGFAAPQPVVTNPAFPAPSANGQLVAAPAPTFPAVGGTPQGALAANPALPAPAPNAAGQVAAAPGTAFPTLGGTGQAPAGTAQVATAPTTTFPTLGGTAQAAPAANPAFPTVGSATQQAPTGNAPAFPQVGDAAPAGTLAAAPQQTSTFPVLGGAVAGATAAEATQTLPNAAGIAEAQPPSGDATIALAAAPQVALPDTAVERFSILGLSTGQPLEEALTTLESEGYGSCKTIDAITHCLTAAGANQDIVSIHAMKMADGTQHVAALSRRIEFGQPMQKADLSSMMADRYAGLLAAPANLVGTADCMAMGRIATSSSTELADEIMTEDNGALAKMIDNCGHFSRIVFGAGTEQSAVDYLSIFLFDGAVFAASPERPKAAAPIKF